MKRAALATMLVVLTASSGAAQSVDTAGLAPGTRIRVWYQPYGLAATRAVVRARTSDSLRFFAANTGTLRGERIDDMEVAFLALDSLEVGRGRSPIATVRGAIIGLVLGYGLGVVTANATGASAPRERAESETAAERRHTQATRFKQLGAVAGTALGALRGANNSERWEAVRIR